jgi:hypothetical protein
MNEEKVFADILRNFRDFDGDFASNYDRVWNIAGIFRDNLIPLKSFHIAYAIDLYFERQITPKIVEQWADLLLISDQYDFVNDDERDDVAQFIFEATTPEFYGPICDEFMEFWRLRLSFSR